MRFTVSENPLASLVCEQVSELSPSVDKVQISGGKIVVGSSSLFSEYSSSYNVSRHVGKANCCAAILAES